MIDNEKTIEQKASALRISQLLGADYFLIADLEEITDNNIRDEVYGSKINDLVLTVDVSVKILDGRRGGSIAGKSVRKSKRLHGDEKSNYTDGDITQNLPTLMKQAGKEIAKYFLDNTQKISDFKVDIAKSVKFIVKSNVDNATVELDGVAIGSAPGDFKVPPGLHRVRVTKDGHKSLERDINIYNNFQLKVSLEMPVGKIRITSASGKTSQGEIIEDMGINVENCIARVTTEESLKAKVIKKNIEEKEEDDEDW